MDFDDFLLKHWPNSIDELALATKSCRRQLTAISHSGFLSPVLLYGDCYVGKFTVATTLIASMHHPLLFDKEVFINKELTPGSEALTDVEFKKIKSIADSVVTCSRNANSTGIFINIETYTEKEQSHLISGLETTVAGRKHSQFIFCVENISKVHPDIISQCIVINITKPSNKSWVPHINRILSKEGFEPLTPNQIASYIKPCCGSPRRILERVHKLCEEGR